jgi:hypothetical protein
MVFVTRHSVTDGTIVFPVTAHGTLGEPRFQDGGGGSPWYFLFLRHRPDTFVLGYAVGDGVALGRIDEDGNISVGPITEINTFRGKPTELCWLSATPDDQMVFSTNFGYGYLTSYRIDGNVITIVKDPACAGSRGLKLNHSTRWWPAPPRTTWRPT